MRISMPHPAAGLVPLVASPLRLSKTPARYRLAPPALGAQTREVLTELLDMPNVEIDALAARGIV
jgi:crotonobetainyl-CoA:carnitine CoA-transferase CaiB-like acyl-CoA transferase